MKLLIILSLLASTAAFATETKTECPWMKEMNRRTNPKAGLVAQQAVKPVKQSNAVKQ